VVAAFSVDSRQIGRAEARHASRNLREMPFAASVELQPGQLDLAKVARLAKRITGK
jgi:hypothetical protein